MCARSFRSWPLPERLDRRQSLRESTARSARRQPPLPVICRATSAGPSALRCQPEMRHVQPRPWPDFCPETGPRPPPCACAATDARPCPPRHRATERSHPGPRSTLRRARGDTATALVPPHLCLVMAALNRPRCRHVCRRSPVSMSRNPATPSRSTVSAHRPPEGDANATTPAPSRHTCTGAPGGLGSTGRVRAKALRISDSEMFPILWPVDSFTARSVDGIAFDDLDQLCRGLASESHVFRPPTATGRKPERAWSPRPRACWPRQSRLQGLPKPRSRKPR